MEPDFVTVSCYRLSTETHTAVVVVNRNFISSCHPEPDAKSYYAQLIMANSVTYYISETDCHRLFPLSGLYNEPPE